MKPLAYPHLTNTIDRLFLMLSNHKLERQLITHLKTQNFELSLDDDFDYNLATFQFILQTYAKTYTHLTCKIVVSLTLDDSDENYKFNFLFSVYEGAELVLSSKVNLAPTANRKLAVSIDTVDHRNNLDAIRAVLDSFYLSIADILKEHTVKVAVLREDYAAQLNLTQRRLREINPSLTIQQEVTDEGLTIDVLDTSNNFKRLLTIKDDV